MTDVYCGLRMSRTNLGSLRISYDRNCRGVDRIEMMTANVGQRTRERARAATAVDYASARVQIPRSLCPFFSWSKREQCLRVERKGAVSFASRRQHQFQRNHTPGGHVSLILPGPYNGGVFISLPRPAAAAAVAPPSSSPAVQRYHLVARTAQSGPAGTIQMQPTSFSVQRVPEMPLSVLASNLGSRV
eukprot:3937094-Rhodomonas_salina.1